MPQSYCCLLYHAVFSTKDRRPWLDSDIRDRVFQYIGGIIRNEGGIPLLVGGTDDHVHLLAMLRQDRAVADELRIIKSKSSGWIHETFPEMARLAWQNGYGAFTVSASQKKRVYAYIERQADHHRKEDFKTEFIRLLKAHDLEYDERYIWQ